MIRDRLRRRLLDRMRVRAAPIDAARLERPTLVLAPHPDDETLGCGGLVAQLADRGTAVDIAFMTDGAGSHSGIDVAELIAIRRDEAIEACAVLGVPADRLHFLGYPDGGLGDHVPAAAQRIRTLFDDRSPSQVVAPHPFEPNLDHHATFRVLELAVEGSGRAVDALLYAVWFWDQWPWTDPLAPPRPRHGRRQMVEAAWRGRLGLGVGHRLPLVVDISTVLDRKRSALAAHASQTTRPADRPDWLTLGDVAGGQWLGVLLEPWEAYAPTRLGPAGGR